MCDCSFIFNSVKLSRSVRRHLRNINRNFKFNNSLRTYYLTVEDLLAHRTGIPKNDYMRLANDYTIQIASRYERFAFTIRLSTNVKS